MTQNKVTLLLALLSLASVQSNFGWGGDGEEGGITDDEMEKFFNDKKSLDERATEIDEDQMHEENQPANRQRASTLPPTTAHSDVITRERSNTVIDPQSHPQPTERQIVPESAGPSDEDVPPLQDETTDATNFFTKNNINPDNLDQIDAQYFAFKESLTTASMEPTFTAGAQAFRQRLVAFFSSEDYEGKENNLAILDQTYQDPNEKGITPQERLARQQKNRAMQTEQINMANYYIQAIDYYKKVLDDNKANRNELPKETPDNLPNQPEKPSALNEEEQKQKINQKISNINTLIESLLNGYKDLSEDLRTKFNETITKLKNLFTNFPNLSQARLQLFNILAQLNQYIRALSFPTVSDINRLNTIINNKEITTATKNSAQENLTKNESNIAKLNNLGDEIDALKFTLKENK